MNEELNLCHSYNRKLLRIYSKSFYLSTLLLPRKKRKAVSALYGFCRFVDNIVDKPRNRTSYEISGEVNYLADELKIAYKRGESLHPVLCSFVQVALEYGIPVHYPLDLFRGVLMDVEKNEYADFNDLYIFCYRVAGVVGLMMTYILGTVSKQAGEYSVKLGIAMQLSNILRDIQEDKNNGRIYLPVDEMERFGVVKGNILKEKFTDSFRELMKFSVNRANQYYTEAEPGIKMLTKETRFAIYSASDIYRNIINEIIRNDYNPFLGRVYVRQSKKLRIIFSNYFREKLNLK